ncbi:MULTISPECIES: tail fiber domain-containing protein [Rhodomicrobium]|uniref:tail fiber domain-containing protein n=1 Tax=Rhodomicrobium TaxID=1068 RepID=UPI000F749991|nr:MULTISPECIES: tail fiber domain-containing protein [Rhodomicrobium]
MGKPSAPKQPDPIAVAGAQTASNVETAREQARLAMTGQSNAFGTLDYVKDPNSPSGYRAVTKLDPAQQALLDQQRVLQGTLGDTAGLSLDRFKDTIGTPFDLNAARGTEISDIQKTFLDPQWSQQASTLENQLINKGIRPGSKQYQIAMSQFGQQKDNAYNRMFLDAYNVANNAALTERNLPLSDYSTLMGFNQPISGAPGNVSTPTPGVSTTPVGQYTYDSYNIANQNRQNQQAGLYGLAGTLGAATIMSDRRFKEAMVPIGKLPNGLTIWSFRYKGEEGFHQGLMADEVRELHPEAVINMGGVDHVNYEMAVH